ncbi:hypothetical protein JVT61DRAFT_13714 [Boletus reticuloceps]|uniref:Uncharacterized protein n=1 Tax=Boletus reticuloceps TaxID=495285 RepID=A0A8I2YRY3_9AGAM|nr:hypothetical protein JVT61DRAFT_13714 [Boletus reticuloceps]
MTVYHQYKNNDLNDQEMALVGLLVNEARVLHSQEMVDKSNEIKWHDYIIKVRDERIEQLEHALAHRIYNEQYPRRPNILADPNTQNYKSWTASATASDKPSNAIAVDATIRATTI